MYKHNINLEITNDSEELAKEIAKDQLIHYRKNNVEIIDAKETKKGHFSINVSYEDKYEDDAVFLSEDFLYDHKATIKVESENAKNAKEAEEYVIDKLKHYGKEGINILSTDDLQDESYNITVSYFDKHKHNLSFPKDDYLYEHNIKLKIVPEDVSNPIMLAQDQLIHYGKKYIAIGEVKSIEDNKFEVEVTYFDKYEKDGLFPTEDYISDEEIPRQRM